MQREVANTDQIPISALMVPYVSHGEVSQGDVTPPGCRRVIHRWRTVFVPVDQPVAYTPQK